MPVELDEFRALDLWRRTTLSGVRGVNPRDLSGGERQPDLTARQFALLLTVYMRPPPHTVRELATLMNISKPAVTRAVDRLSELELVQRKTDENDRRSVLIQRTLKGRAFLTEFAGQVIVAGRQVA